MYNNVYKKTTTLRWLDEVEVTPSTMVAWLRDALLRYSIRPHPDIRPAAETAVSRPKITAVATCALEGFQQASAQLLHGHGSYDAGDCIGDALERNRFKVTGKQRCLQPSKRILAVIRPTAPACSPLSPTPPPSTLARTPEIISNHRYRSIGSVSAPLVESAGMAVKYICAGLGVDSVDRNVPQYITARRR